MMRKYLDLHIYSDNSIGSSSIKEVVDFAEKLNLSTIALLDYKDKKQLAELKKEIQGIKTQVEILVGAELVAGSVSDLKVKIKQVRDVVDILAVYGGNLKINRAAVEDPRVDILIHPEFKRKDSGMDDVMARLAAENFVAIELNFREFLHSSRKSRSFVLRKMKQNAMLAEKYNAPVIVASGAESVWDMRAGRELSSLAHLCGLPIVACIDSVSKTPERVMTHVKKVNSNKFVMPGVEIK